MTKDSKKKETTIYGASREAPSKIMETREAPSKLDIPAQPKKSDKKISSE